MKNKTQKIKYHIGCSGFYYNEWKGNFYPDDLPKSKWFGYYNQKFDTVEINATFYRTMKQSFFDSLYKKSDENFQFSVKASRIITHYKKFRDTQSLLEDFYKTIHSGLKEKLGCVLFQLPGNIQYSAEYLERITESLDPAYRNVVEFRHESWWNDEVYKNFKKKNITFCNVSYPGIPFRLVLNDPTVYVRLHGDPILYRSSYNKSFLKDLAKNLTRSKNTKEVYVYFDNTYTAAAIKNAIQLKSMIEELS